MNRPLEALLIDHDGTLVDSEPCHYRLWRDILARFGVDISIEEYVSHHAGLPSVANAMRMLELNPTMPATAEALADAKDKAVDDFLETGRFPLKPGVAELLESSAKRGVRLGVVTGAAGAGVALSLRAHELLELFSTVVAGDEVENGKPAPDGYLLAAQRLGVDPVDCVAIEDTGAGIAAAYSAGMACIAVPTEMSATHDFARADVVVDDLHAAGEWIWSNFTVR